LTIRLFFSLLLVLTVLGPFGACHRGPRKGDGSASKAAVGKAAPRLKLGEGRYELGPVVQDESVHRSITVSNPGALPLEISAIEASRFCSASIAPYTIAPGASGQLEVTCRSDLHGPLREFLWIHSNDPLADRIPIELVGNVTPHLAFDAPVVTLEMPFGEEQSQEVHVVGKLLDSAAVRLKDSALAVDSSVDLLSSQTGSIQGFRIRCKGKKAGMHAGNLVVATGLAQPKEIAMPYSCKVAGTLEVSPTNPYFNLKISGPKVVSIEVRSTQPGFEVHGARVIEGPFSASVDGRISENAFRVQVKVLEDRLTAGERGTLGKLVILSNDRTEPEKEVPLFGFGKLNSVPADELTH